MSMIPDELIEQIRESADLVEIIGEAVQLKRTGSDYRGSCPFHGGTHRNFAVIPKKGMYYCYVCHAAGDVFTYLMKRQGMDYPTAVREIARRVGIVVPERGGGREAPDDREPLFAAAAIAQEWFAARLREDPEANAAREYLAEREIPPEVAGEHGLGYAPRGKAFTDAMKQLGIEERVLLEAGLLFKRDDGTVFPRFRSRLLFPINDLRGRIVGFSGRIIGTGEPKYLNSPETRIFHKGAMLYNLHHAKQAIRREESAILVEGQFDVLRLVMAGIDHVVAPQGTGLTPDQAALLRRFAPSVTLLYDSDSAGLRATFRAAEEFLRHKLRVKVATMPEGEDPDTLVRKGGAAALAPILKDAVDVLDRKIQILERSGRFEDLERRREALDKLLDTARAATDPIARDLYLARIAEKTGVTRAVLEQELNDRPEPRAPAPPSASPSPPFARSSPSSPSVRPPARVRGQGAGLEEKLLRTLCAAPSWLARARQEVSPETFEVPAFREIYEGLLALPEGAAPGAAVERVSARAQEALQRLLHQSAEATAAGMNFDDEYVGALRGLASRSLSRTLAPVSAITERQTQLKQFPPEERTRIVFRNQAEKARRGPAGNPGPDHSQHP
jgi:DNA primase